MTSAKKIPLALKPKLEKELKHIVDVDVIELIQKPTNWGNGLVVEKPNRKLWVCLNPQPLNKAIKREHLFHPTAKEISKMSEASYFSN